MKVEEVNGEYPTINGFEYDEVIGQDYYFKGEWVFHY